MLQGARMCRGFENLTNALPSEDGVVAFPNRVVRLKLNQNTVSACDPQSPQGVRARAVPN